MPSPHAEPQHVSQLQRLLQQRGAKHLRVRKNGSALVVESGPVADSIKHFRVRRDTVHFWLLDMADHRGHWERTPFRAYLDELVATVLDNFPWTVAPRE
jgi:hypothetical protein